MFKRKPVQTFDDVASERVKRARVLIKEAAQEALINAANCAANGEDMDAKDWHFRYHNLKGLALTIPLDMIEAGL